MKKRAAQKKGKVSTGNEFLDRLTNGGFEKNSSNLVVGNSGSGKTIFGVQFLIEGLKKNEACMYLTFEEKKENFYDNMLDLGWNLAELEKKGKFHFLQYSPKKVKTMLEEGGGIIETIIVREKITRLVIDSITSFVVLFDREIRKREAVLSLFNILRNWNCTTLLIYEGNPLQKKSIDNQILEFECDSLIYLYYLREKDTRNRFLEVIKMRGSEHEKKIYPFTIDQGITLINKPYIGKLKE
ncbi:hypothetical protein J4456_04575 [Candidatus Pacearchaeota archaeon]|nr:hypothetical protein [Candidatus Pacearchaeota archaeon]